MPKITAVDKIYRKSNLREITLDDGDKCIVLNESVYTNGVKVENSYYDNEWLEMLANMQYELGMNYALGYISYGNKSIYEIVTNLRKKEVSEIGIERTIQRLKVLRYVDDERYAVDYVNSYKQSRGQIRLRIELRNKGVENEYIENAISGLDNEHEYARELANRFMKSREWNNKEKDRLIRHLLAKGYSYDIVKSVICDFGDNCEY